MEEDFLDDDDANGNDFSLVDEALSAFRDWQQEPDNQIDDIASLFDMSTVEGKPTLRMVKKKAIHHNTLLVDGKITFQTDLVEYYDEVPETVAETKNESLDLNIFRGCGKGDALTGAAPAMPSLRLDMLDKEYQEPTRSRDKNWKLDSQRDILNSIPDPLDRAKLKPGKYDNTVSIPPLYWSPAFQNLIRKSKLFRTSAIISETDCVVDIFGIGINGRVFAEGSTSGRLMVVEAYSVWNSSKYVLALSCGRLRTLFADRPHLFKAGRKLELVRCLIELLYFVYTIETVELEDDGVTEESRSTQVVEHLQRPLMPDGYPQTVPELVRLIGESPGASNTQFPIPSLAQELCISSVRRVNGAIGRRRDAEALRKRLAEEEEARRRAWLAIPRFKTKSQ